MIPITQHKNRTIRVATSPIIENALAKTFLSVDMAASSGTLTVTNIEKFAIAKYVWINPFSERSEIIAVHASTAPSGSTITLAAATTTTYAHYAGEPVYYVEFNQAEFNHAATLTGSKSVLATAALEAGRRETVYLDTSQTSGYYFVRFKDSVAGTFSGYSDGVIYGGFASNTVGYMIDRALKDLSLELTDKITVLDCYAWLNEGMLDIKGKIKRWPEHFVDNSIIGQVTRGTRVVSMPSTIYDDETNKSILGLRIGSGKNLIYKDPTEFDGLLEGENTTQVRTQAVATDTSLAVDNSYDFEDSGSLNFYISGTKYTITYTAVTRDTATGATAAFTGIPASGTGAITVTIPVDTNIWQNEVEGMPTYFTVRNGQIEFTPLADSTEDNANVYMDYNTVATAVDTEGDEIDFQRFNILQAYLTWRMESKEKGLLNAQSPWLLLYKERLNDAIRTLPPSRVAKTAPKINRMSKRGPLTADLQRLSVSEQ